MVKTQQNPKILWLSRHKPTKSQIDSLEMIYGKDVKIIRDGHRSYSVQDMIKLFKDGGYIDLVVVAPMFVISKLAEAGVYPLWAQMKQVERNIAETSNEGRYYSFIEFIRIKKLCFEHEKFEKAVFSI